MSDAAVETMPAIAVMQKAMLEAALESVKSFGEFDLVTPSEAASLVAWAGNALGASESTKALEGIAVYKALGMGVETTDAALQTDGAALIGMSPKKKLHVIELQKAIDAGWLPVERSEWQQMDTSEKSIAVADVVMDSHGYDVSDALDVADAAVAGVYKGYVESVKSLLEKSWRPAASLDAWVGLTSSAKFEAMKAHFISEFGVDEEAASELATAAFAMGD